MKAIQIKEVMKAIDALTGDIVVFFDKDASRFLYIPKQYQKQIDRCLMSRNMVPFLTLQDIPFIEIREKFIATLSGNLKKEFENAFVGESCLLKFKKTLSRTHQWEEFNSFEYERYKQLARIWCEQNHIPYC